jgi:DNA-binding MarR family transcriptional regulator
VNHIHDPGGPPDPQVGAEPLDRLFALTVLMADAMEHDLAERELTRARATVISLLHAGGPMKQRDLAAALSVSPRNVSGLLEALAPSGLVDRAPHPADGRATLVSLSERGQRVAERLEADRQELARFLFDAVPEADLAGYLATMDRLLQQLQSPAFGELRRAAGARWAELD